MNPTDGPFSWLMPRPASPATFGALGSGGTGVGSNAGVNNGMPMSSLGPGANIGQGSPGLLPALLAKFGQPGGAPGSAPAGNNGSAPGAGQSTANPALGIAQRLMQQQPLTPATFNWNMR